MIGHIGFHTAPDPAYLAATVGRGIEVGYTVFAAFRRRGFAEEALRGMLGWAHSEHAVTQFVASIAPENLPSQNLAAKLGFVKVGEQTDEIDGIEDVLLLRLPA
jgi:RimJ/RimL family protein N-acetyltransferase